MQKLETSLSRQQRHYVALAKFLNDGGRIRILQGNHDADWFFPANGSGPPPLQKRIREVLSNPPEDKLEFIATYLRVGTVHIEHGHQRCEFVNGFQQHPNIFHADRISPLTGDSRMELLWGSRMVMEFFNDLETKYPFADNLKSISRAIWLGIHNGWLNGTVASSFLRFLLGAGLPLRDFGEVLEGPKDPMLLIQSLRDDSLKALLLERVSRDPTFYSELAASLAQVPEEEKRVWRASKRSEMGREEVTALGTQGVAGLIREAREFREAGDVLKAPGVSAVIFGHTHFAIDGNSSGAKTKKYFNTGTWTAALDLNEAAVEQRLASGNYPLELLGDRLLFRVRLTYAEITEKSDGCTVELKQM